jgi:hypothetical protein
MCLFCVSLLTYLLQLGKSSLKSKTHTHTKTQTQTHIHTNTHKITIPTQYLLTPSSRVLLEKLTGSQLAKKFPILYGPRLFITAFKSARHLSLS